MTYKISKISVKNFRSLLNISIEPVQGVVSICGTNNIGKTNFLRAIKLFFTEGTSDWCEQTDIPNHIYNGSRGGGTKTTISIDFIDPISNHSTRIEKIYQSKSDEDQCQIVVYKHSVELSDEEARIEAKKVIGSFECYFLEASNIDIPALVADILNEDVLPLALDRRRGKNQQSALNSLNDFIEKSKTTLTAVEVELTGIFKETLDKVESISSDDWALKLIFPEYNYLRDAIANMVNFTLVDSNSNSLEFKGSGMQRLVLLSLIRYINRKSITKTIVWLIDEPESFLQPSLQKAIYSELKAEANQCHIYLATHSPHFVDLNNLQNSYLFDVLGTETKQYARRPNTSFIVNEIGCDSNLTLYEKSIKIKTHFGMERGDLWEVMPLNILVEGDTDKKYLQAYFQFCNIETPNIMVAKGAPSYKGYLTYINSYCESFQTKPAINALFDKDSGGQDAYNGIHSNKFDAIILKKVYIQRYDGISQSDFESEDFLPVELIVEAANNILSKEQYKKITRPQTSTRESRANNNIPILKLLTDWVAYKNPDKKRMDFNELYLKLKLCEQVVGILRSGNYETHSSYVTTSMTSFLKELANP